jgi:hypothetical protein
MRILLTFLTAVGLAVSLTISLIGQTITSSVTVTGLLDANAATKFVVKTGTSAPSSSDCNAANERGNYYIQTGDPASVATRALLCVQTGASSYAWHPVGWKVQTTAPATCEVGDVWFDSDATAGSNLNLCTAANTFTQVTGGGGGGTFATQAEALAGTSSTVYMSPLRTTEAVDVRCGGLRTGATTIQVFPGATVGRPCIPAQFLSTAYKFTAPITVTVTGGSGLDTIYFQVLNSGGLNVLTGNSRTFDDIGYTSGAGSDWTVGSAHLFKWTITGTTWDVSGYSEERPERVIDRVIGTGDISCTPSGNVTSCTYTGTSGGSDFATDMTYASWHWLPYPSQPVGGASNPGVYCVASASGVGESSEIVAGEPARGQNWFTGGTPASGDYASCMWGAGVNAPNATPRWSDFISATNYKAFTLSQVMRVPTITSTIQKVGFWGTTMGASATDDFVGLLLNTDVDSNWRCVSCSGGVCTSSGTTVAATTNVILVTVKSATSGNLECTIGATSMPVAATFATFASGVSPGFHFQTRTTTTRSQTIFETKLKVAR